MANTPLASVEVRWFFEGPARRNFELKHWFESTPMLDSTPGEPAWQGRLDDEPDRYLLIPGGANLGVKWREGQLQVKGLTQDLGVQHFSGGHTGRAQRWMKWSYAKLPEEYRDLFAGRLPGVRTVGTAKTRAMRKFRLDTYSGKASEVPVDQFVDRGLGVELTEIDADGEVWTSLGFEAFPDDSAMIGHFLAAVDTILATLEDPQLQTGHSLSYPAWLLTLGKS